jgi:hypothetical protein
MKGSQLAVIALTFVVAMKSATATQQPPAAAGAKQPPATTSTKQPAKPLTLTGCVNASPTENGVFTLSDTDGGTTYRLVGADVREFVGKHVQVSGLGPRRLQIVGGLYPSANAAAQAGAIDPGQAAIAAASEQAAGTKPPIEFRVKAVRTTPGTCADR